MNDALYIYIYIERTREVRRKKKERKIICGRDYEKIVTLLNLDHTMRLFKDLFEKRVYLIG